MCIYIIGTDIVDYVYIIEITSINKVKKTKKSTFGQKKFQGLFSSKTNKFMIVIIFGYYFFTFINHFDLPTYLLCLTFKEITDKD